MRKLFIGLLFILVRIQIPVGFISIGFPPSFVGYLFLVAGCSELSRVCRSFHFMKFWAMAMVLLETILYGLDLFGFSETVGIRMGLYLALRALSLILNCAFLFSLLRSLEDLENTCNRDLAVSSLSKAWAFWAGIYVVSFFLTLIDPTLQLFVSILQLIGAVWLLSGMWKARKRYEADT